LCVAPAAERRQEWAMLKVNERLDVVWEAGMTVRALLKACNFTFPLINVTVNGVLVKREDWDAFVLPDGADVRVIHLISGG
jgi:thiamine biosynthesis protein ThiS